MEKDLDRIKIESKAELSGLLKVLEKNPEQDNKYLSRLIDLLDGMLMEW